MFSPTLLYGDCRVCVRVCPRTHMRSITIKWEKGAYPHVTSFNALSYKGLGLAESDRKPKITMAWTI